MVGRYKKGVIGWIIFSVPVLIFLSYMFSVNAEMAEFNGIDKNVLVETISDFLVIIGLAILIVLNFISIMLSKYWEIKANSIIGAVFLVLGLIVGVFV